MSDIMKFVEYDVKTCNWFTPNLLLVLIVNTKFDPHPQKKIRIYLCAMISKSPSVEESQLGYVS